MLDTHPELAVSPETNFVPNLVRRCRRPWTSRQGLAEAVFAESSRWNDIDLEIDELRERFQAIRPTDARGAIRAFYNLYAEKRGKPRWGDKTPIYVQHLRTIDRVLPEARFIHVIRDGRDVATSILRRSWGPTTVEQAAQTWKELVTQGRRQGPKVMPYIEVRYESLVLETDPVLRTVCDFLELDFDPAMLDYHRGGEERLSSWAHDRVSRRGDRTIPRSEVLAAHALTKEPPRSERVEAWREEMSEADQARFEGVAGDLLAELGYETRSGAESRPAERSG